jgi:hypothetical protein
MKFLDQAKEFVKNKNSKRAAAVWLLSIAIGLAGFAALGPAGVFVLACVPAVGAGLATSFLSNGYKKPVTGKTRVKSALLILGQFVLTVAVYNLVLGSPLILAIPANISGTAISFVSGQVGLSIMQWENAHLEKKQLQIQIEQAEPEKLSHFKSFQKGLTAKLGKLKISVQRAFGQEKEDEK